MTRPVGWLISLGWVAWATAAQATECGDARLAVAHYKTAAAVEETLKHAAEVFTAKTNLKAAEKKLQTACVPKHAQIVALPLGYVSVPPGNLSKITVEPQEGWRPTVTTLAGAQNGLVLADPATLTLPAGMRWETPVSASKSAGEILIAVATDATITVEEPEAGKGSWRIEVKAPPQLWPISKIRACASGKDASLKLPKSACQMLLSVDPVPQAGALPPRGRALLHGEWQYGWHAVFELGPDELGELPKAPAPARLDLALELTAPLPEISDGKKLQVTLEANQQDRPANATLKLAHGGCADDDEACEKQRFAVEVWFDRVFGVPFLRAPNAAGAVGALTGKVTDRLARPIAGQRVLVTEAQRRAIAITDDTGGYRFDNLMSGDATVVPVGRDPANIPKNDEARSLKVPLTERKVPLIFVNKLWE